MFGVYLCILLTLFRCTGDTCIRMHYVRSRRVRTQSTSLVQGGQADLRVPFYLPISLYTHLLFHRFPAVRMTSLRSDQDDPHSVGEHFFVMADDMLTEEIDGAIGPVRVPITTVQALVVMVMRLLATGNELKAWMFIGTCARMTLEMGLHLDARAFLQGSPASGAHALTENDLYVRATTFWAVWIFEQE